MSFGEEVKQVILTSPKMIPQAKGMEKTVEEIIVTLDLSKAIDRTKSNRFLIKATVSVDNQSYSYAGVHNISELDNSGMLSIGRVYVLGPLISPKVSTSAYIYYLIDPV